MLKPRHDLTTAGRLLILVLIVTMTNTVRAEAAGSDGVDPFQIVVVDDVDADIQLNGQQFAGIALHSIKSNQPVVIAEALPSGETVDLRQQAAH
jgi:hypothetical protein